MTALGVDEYVNCADEKTSIQARRRKHKIAAPRPSQPMRVEHEYARKGAWAYLAAWGVRHARIFGRCEHKTGIAPFGRLARQVMSREPYRSAHRVFWAVDNGTSHRGQRYRERFSQKWPNLIVVHTPIHASWLNQVEIYFSIVQRKVLTPNHFTSLTALEDRLLNFQSHYQEIAKPFQWRFSRQDLDTLMQKLEARKQAAWTPEIRHRPSGLEDVCDPRRGLSTRPGRRHDGRRPAAASHLGPSATTRGTRWAEGDGPP